MRSYLVALTLIAAVFVVLGPRDAEAIPAFARKYETSCHTCHTVYPKLNPFGNAFRLLGYRMPAETEDMIKEVPVPLGADAYKRVWPDQIWPSDIPGTAPLAVDIRMASITQHDAAEGHTIKNDLRFPESVELLAAGTLGETLSFLGALGFAVESEHGESSIATEIEHAEMHFNGPWGSGTTFNVKVGRFTPETTQGLSHGYLMTDSTPAVMFGFNPAGFRGGSEVSGFGHGGGHGGSATIALPAGVDGIEAYGILANRFEYSGGFANGVGPGPEGTMDVNNSKDVFGRIAYKVGGLSLDGADYVASDKNWRETSLQVGVFGYRGDGSGILVQGTGLHADTFVEDQRFTRFGTDINIYLRDLNIIAGYVRGRDSLGDYAFPEEEHGEEPAGDEHGAEPTTDEHDAEPAADEHGAEPDLVFEGAEDFTYNGWFAELDYVFYPWLHGGYRYEWLDPANGSAQNFRRTTANVSALIRANVKAFMEWQRDMGGSREGDYIVKTGLRFAF